MIYAGAQTNIGPAGATLVVLKKEILEIDMSAGIRERGCMTTTQNQKQNYKTNDVQIQSKILSNQELH